MTTTDRVQLVRKQGYYYVRGTQEINHSHRRRHHQPIPFQVSNTPR